MVLNWNSSMIPIQWPRLELSSFYVLYLKPVRKLNMHVLIINQSAKSRQGYSIECWSGPATLIYLRANSLLIKDCKVLECCGWCLRNSSSSRQWRCNCKGWALYHQNLQLFALILSLLQWKFFWVELYRIFEPLLTRIVLCPVNF